MAGSGATVTAAEVTDAPDAPVPADPARRKGWRPAPIHRVRDLDLRGRTVFVGLLVLTASLPVLSSLIVLRQGWRPIGDNALIGLRVHDVLTGHFPLIGQPTTGENFGSGIATSHPGPIEFYLIAPFTAILGPRIGLVLGAGIINAVALAVIGWLSFRRGGLGLMVLASVTSAALARSLGGNLLHDPVSSNVGALAAVALLFAAWSILAGDIRVTPAFVVAGTFALQDHLTYLGTGAPVVVVALVLGGWWVRRIATRASGAPWLRPRLLLSAVIGVVLWFPVLLDEVFGAHNLTAIFRTFTGKRTPGEGLHFALGRVAESLAPWPLFSRRVGPLGYLHSPALHEWVGGYLVLVVIAALGARAWRRRDGALAAMAAVALLATVAGFYTAVKLPVGAGIQASNLRWMWTVSAFAWITMLRLVWDLLPDLWRAVGRPPALAVGTVLLLVASHGVVGSIDLQSDRDGSLAGTTATLIDRVEARLPKGTYRVTFAGGSVVVSVGPALVHDLDYRGDTLYVDVGPFTRAYADHRRFDGQRVDGTILVTAEANGSYPEGTRLVARQQFAVNRKDAEVNTIRVYLVKGDA
jgi:hypothetical protein